MCVQAETHNSSFDVDTGVCLSGTVVFRLMLEDRVAYTVSPEK